MKTELKTKWLEALRSGKYTQGTGFLRERDSYCCLGVLCDVAGKEWVAAGEETYYPAGAPLEFSLFNNDLRKEFEISEKRMFELTKMNDSGRSFLEIADHIERNI